MNTHLDRALRDALGDLAEAEGPPPTGLARAAVRQAGRRRRSRIMLGVTAGIAVLGAVPFAVAGLASNGGSAPETAGGQPLPPHVITAYAGIPNPADPGPADDASLLLNYSTGQYVEVPYNVVVPSPDGSHAIVEDGDNSAAHPSRIGVLDRATLKVRWLPGNRGYQGGASWSPDGGRFVLTDRPRQGSSGFIIVDASTLAESVVGVPDVETANVIGQSVVWTPGGTELALVLSATINEATHVIQGIRNYNLDGSVKRTVAVNNLPADTAVFAPDGVRLVVSGYGGQTTQIIDTSTGAATALPSADHVVGWVDGTHLLMSAVQKSSANGQTSALPADLPIIDLTGHSTGTVHIPQAAAKATSVHIGSSAGLTPNAVALAF
jgi:hypothetical protein